MKFSSNACLASKRTVPLVRAKGKSSNLFLFTGLFVCEGLVLSVVHAESQRSPGIVFGDNRHDGFPDQHPHWFGLSRNAAQRNAAQPNPGCRLPPTKPMAPAAESIKKHLLRVRRPEKECRF
ncbi:MAG: hypothetical protein H7Z75_22720 [Ferruginibacter sp.]|nr:hypothetical protein [Cytophagales bacterium]